MPQQALLPKRRRLGREKAQATGSSFPAVGCADGQTGVRWGWPTAGLSRRPPGRATGRSGAGAGPRQTAAPTWSGANTSTNQVTMIGGIQDLDFVRPSWAHNLHVDLYPHFAQDLKISFF